MEDIINIQIPDDILYLVHTTSRKYKDEDGKIIWTEIQATGTDQYPGSYFSLITKDNRLTEKLFPSKDCLVFSRNCIVLSILIQFLYTLLCACYSFKLMLPITKKT
jgi:hypothetical protein